MLRARRSTWRDLEIGSTDPASPVAAAVHGPLRERHRHERGP